MNIIDKSYRATGDITKLMQPGRPRTQDLQGFDDDYTDIVDYIVRCTHKIWEEGGMGLIYSHYQHNCLVHTPYGASTGVEEVLSGSVAVLASLPDRRLFAEDVIWAGDDQAGFHTSHRIGNLAHNTGHGPYGPPTGRRVAYRGIANCTVKENRIVEEWLVRDEGALVRQLGLDPFAVARRLVEQGAGRSAEPFGQGETRRVVGQLPPTTMQPAAGGAFDVEDFVRRTLHEIWNWRLFNRITSAYAANFQCWTAGNRSIYGLGDYQAYVMALIAMFPDAHLQIDHLYWQGNDDEGYRVASRWTLQGTHLGAGVYSSPSGKRVDIMGISHFWVQQGVFVREWTVFDEVALLKQVVA
jgi:predicted ester cyclase